jgi:hypothetical protein
MKKASYIITLFVIVTLYSCNQVTTTGSTEQKDNRPKDELAFVKALDNAYQNTSNQINDINKKDAADSNKAKISRFIIDTLKTNIKNWQVTIFDIDAESLEMDGGIDIKLLLSKNAQLPEKNPEFDALILQTHIVNNDSLKNMFKPLQKGDKVLLTGKFETEKDEHGNLLFFPANSGVIREEYIFDSPAFNIIITDIKKANLKN